MASTRSTISPPIFASNASTVVPPTPVAGVSYRDPIAGPASSPDGWPYAERVNSAEFNQIMFQLSSIASIIDKKGILGWSNLVDYTEASVVFGSDGSLYAWLVASGPNNGGAKDPVATTGSWAPLSALMSNGLAGDAMKVRASISIASSTATFTADQVVVSESLSGRSYRLSSFSEVINLATVGIGGMDVGSPPVNGYVAIYAIYNANGDINLLAVNSTSIVAPTVYAGGNMPAGYIASALIGVWGTNAGAQFRPGLQLGRRVYFTPVQSIITSVQQPALTSISISNAIPPNAISYFGAAQIASTSSGAITQALLAASASGIGQISILGSAPAGNNASGAPSGEVPIMDPQTTFYSVTASAGTMSAIISVSGYDF